MNNMEKKICFAEETYGVTINRRYLKFPQSRNKDYTIETKNIRWKSIANFFTTIFLPHGFPKSVSKDYLQYQMWDSIQAFASSITGSISTHAVLKGVGVGDENASPLAATITWLIKDGTSMVGRIIFAWLQGTKLDSDCKKWRLFADILNDMAIFLDLISAYFKEHFLIIICISGLIKSIVGVAGGATRAALTQHQARQNNMADVSAKDGSQETLVNLAALICSLVIIPTVIHNHVMIWLLYAMMTVIHLFSNYLAVKSVIMETFNVARFQIFMEHYLLSNMENVATIDEVNKRENVFVLPWVEPISIKLGASLNDVIERTEDIRELINLYKGSDYILNINCFSSEKASINISLHHKSNILTQIESMYQAFILVNIITKGKKSQLWHLYECENTFHKGNETQEITLVKFSRRFTQKNFSSFVKKIRECGWDTNSVVFGADMWRVKW